MALASSSCIHTCNAAYRFNTLSLYFWILLMFIRMWTLENVFTVCSSQWHITIQCKQYKYCMYISWIYICRLAGCIGFFIRLEGMRFQEDVHIDLLYSLYSKHLILHSLMITPLLLLFLIMMVLLDTSIMMRLTITNRSAARRTFFIQPYIRVQHTSKT